MPRCSHCGELIVGSLRDCPSCGPSGGEAAVESTMTEEGWFQAQGDALHGPSDRTPLTAVARFGNAAEAGYFAHELTHVAGIPAVTSVEESFDALTGYWSARFVLAVPDAESQRATEVLSGLIEQSDPDGFDDLGDAESAETYGDLEGRPRRPVTQRMDESAVHWVPIVLTLTAGSVAFWGARKFNEQPQAQIHPGQPAGQQHEELWDHLASPTGPWIQRLEGAGVRELRVDAERRRAFIREDRNGDGLFEREFAVER